MSASVELIQVPEWAEYPWLRHGFTSRSGGCTLAYGGEDLNLGFTGDDSRESVAFNRGIALAAVGAGGRLVTVKQVHGTDVVVASGDVEPVQADGMMTAAPGVVLGIQVADCVPVLLADTRLRVVAAVHAGWRGTVGRIAARAIERLGEEFGSRPEDVVAAIGPSIGPCCYAVGEEVIERAGRESGFLEQRGAGIYFDLWEANRCQLAGCRVKDVQVLGLCTACSQVEGRRRFFSHRAEAGVTGRAMGLIGIA